MDAADMPRDEVDDLVTAWQRERPDLPVEPMQVWSRIDRLALRLDAARRVAYAAHDLETWEFDVLAALRRSGEPYRATPGRLLRETHVTSGTMTNRLDRLTSRGFVERQQDDSDRRVFWVSLTEAGRSRVDAALTSLLDAERNLLADLDAGATGQLGAALRVLLAAQDRAPAS